MQYKNYKKTCVGLKVRSRGLHVKKSIRDIIQENSAQHNTEEAVKLHFPSHTSVPTSTPRRQHITYTLPFHLSQHSSN